MSTQYRLVQSGKTASGGCSAGQGSSEPVAPSVQFSRNLTAKVLLKFASKTWTFKENVQKDVYHKKTRFLRPGLSL
jgi:hypothetical protein